MAGKHLLEQGEKRRKEILLYLRSYIANTGWAPTIQEICDAVGLVSPNATRSHLRRLEEMGFITMKPRVARAIALADPQPDIKLLTTIKPTRKPRQPVAPVEVTIVEREAPAKPARRRREKVPA